MAKYEELLPFYGPLQDVVPSSKDLVPPAFVQEIEGWKPVVGEDVNTKGCIITSDKFSGACSSIFSQNRFYLNMSQLEQAAHLLVGLWGKESSESKKRAVDLSTNKQKPQMIIQCSFIRWKIIVVPVKGRGKGAAHRIMSGLDLDEPGLEVIKIKESFLESRGSNPLYFHAPPRPNVLGAAIKQEKECPYGPLDATNNQRETKLTSRAVTPSPMAGQGKGGDPLGQEKRAKIVDVTTDRLGQESNSPKCKQLKQPGLDHRTHSESKKRDKSNYERTTSSSWTAGEDLKSKAVDSTIDLLSQDSNVGAGDNCKEPKQPSLVFRKLKAPSDIALVSSDGNRFPTHKTMLAAASPTLKTIIIEAGKGFSEIHMTYPARLVRAALTAMYTNEPLDADLAANHLESCMEFASDYQLVKFQRVVHRAMLGRLNMDNFKRALLEARKTKDESFKQGCFEFAKKHPRQVLRNRSVVRLATEVPSLWDEFVEALHGTQDSSDEAEESRMDKKRSLEGDAGTSIDGASKSKKRQRASST